MSEIYNLAFDLGASSGRLILSAFDGEKITLNEIHRFAIDQVKMGGRMYWDIFRIFEELKTGLKTAVTLKKDLNIDLKKEISGIGIDCWGVDYVLLDKQDNIIGLPIAYRDSRTNNIIDKISKTIPLEEIYSSTGIQFMSLNTLYQFYSDKQMRSDAYNNAKYYLSIPDFLNFCLTGRKFNEYTHASTTQMINALDRSWDMELLNRLSLRTDLFCDMIFPGNKIGVLTKEIQEEINFPAVPIYAVGSHDTASAVASVPFSDKNSAFLSCGTWSLFGVELDDPILSEKAFRYNFTNEGGVEGKIRFLKNINGLWILQQLRKSYNNKYNKKITFPDIIFEARQAKAKHFRIDPSDESFIAPIDMAEAISDYCLKTGQGKPESLGELAIATYNGLTNEYSIVTNALEELLNKPITNINMIGGGIQDEFLCEETARVTGKTVIAGPVEGSVLGNIIVQLQASGHIKNISEGREIIKRSFCMKTYTP